MRQPRSPYPPPQPWPRPAQRRPRAGRALALLGALLATAALALAGCGEDQGSPVRLTAPEGADAEAGRDAIRVYGCGTCHVIPGISGANAHVGPPLVWFARRNYIGGVILNTPDNLVQWIIDPQTINPLTAMPSVGASEEDARNIAAYLATLD